MQCSSAWWSGPAAERGLDRLAALREPVRIGGLELNINASIGIAVYPSYADYQAKTDRTIPVLIASAR